MPRQNRVAEASPTATYPRQRTWVHAVWTSSSRRNATLVEVTPLVKTKAGIDRRARRQVSLDENARASPHPDHEALEDRAPRTRWRPRRGRRTLKREAGGESASSATAPRLRHRPRWTLVGLRRGDASSGKRQPANFLDIAAAPRPRSWQRPGISSATGVNRMFVNRSSAASPAATRSQRVVPRPFAKLVTRADTRLTGRPEPLDVATNNAAAGPADPEDAALPGSGSRVDTMGLGAAAGCGPQSSRLRSHRRSPRARSKGHRLLMAIFLNGRTPRSSSRHDPGGSEA